MYRIIDLYKNLESDEHLLPTNTGLSFWEAIYTANASVMDREFARRFAGFRYFDFMGSVDKDEATANFQADVLSILTFNKKRYEEMYRIFLVADNDFPFIYNYRNSLLIIFYSYIIFYFCTRYRFSSFYNNTHF